MTPRTLMQAVAGLTLLTLPTLGWTGQAQPSASPLKGEYFCTRNEDSVCVPYTKNLNQFRRIDFDVCDPRLSEKYPQFTRPAWDEIPLDLALVELIIKNIYSRAGYDEIYWQEWLKVSEPLRQEGKIKLWRTQIDIDADGKPETLLRLEHPLTPKEWAEGKGWVVDASACVYRNSIMYMVESSYEPPARRLRADREQMKKGFNLRASYATDIIHFSGRDVSPGETNGYYAVDRRVTLPSFPDGKRIGATRGMIVYQLNDWGAGKVCSIDWVPTGHYRPLQRSRTPR